MGRGGQGRAERLLERRYLRAVFTGTSIAIRLTEPTLLAVSVDGHSPHEVHGNVGLTVLNDKPLDNKRDHTLQVGSAGQNYEVAFAGLQLDPGAMTKTAGPRPLIEYVGDSITQGNESYAWRSAQMLGCDHVQIAFSGVALTDGFGCSTKVGMAVQYFRLKIFNHTTEPAAPWTFPTRRRSRSSTSARTINVKKSPTKR